MAETSREPEARITLKDLPENEREAKELTEQQSEATKGGLAMPADDGGENDILLP